MYGMSAKDRLAMFQSKASGETKKSTAPTKKVGKLTSSSTKKTTKTTETKTSVKKEVTKSESGDKVPSSEENVTVVEEKISTEGTTGKGGATETKVTKTEKIVSKSEGGVKSTETTKTEKVTEKTGGEQKTVKDEVKKDKVTEELPKKTAAVKVGDKVDSSQKKPADKTEVQSKTTQEVKTKVTEKIQKAAGQDSPREKAGLEVPPKVSSSKGQLTAKVVLTGGESDLDLDSEFEANIDFVSDAEAITPMVEAQKPAFQKKQKVEAVKQKPKESKPSAEPTTKEGAKPPKPPNKEHTVSEQEAKTVETQQTQEIKETTKAKSVPVSNDAAALISHETREQVIIESEPQVEKEAVVKIVTVTETTETDKESVKQSEKVSVVASVDKDAKGRPADGGKKTAAETKETAKEAAIQEKVEKKQVEKAEVPEKPAEEILEVKAEQKQTADLILTSGTTPTVVLGPAEDKIQNVAEKTEGKSPGEGAEAIEVVQPEEGNLIISAEIETEENPEAGNEATILIADTDVTISGDLVASDKEKTKVDTRTPPVEGGQLIISASIETSEDVYENPDESGKPEKEKKDDSEEIVKIEESKDEEPVPEVSVKDKNEPFYPKLHCYNPLPDEFYDTIFYFSGMGRVIGTALAQGVYVNSKAAKSALDLGELEKLNESKEASKKEDMIKTVRHQAQDLSLDLRHLQTLLDGLPNFQDSEKASGDVHLVFKQTDRGPKRSRSQPPIRQPDPEYPPWVKTGTVQMKVQSSTHHQGKVPVMPGMPQYQVSQDGWLQAPPRPQVLVETPAMKATQLPVEIKKKEPEAIKEVEEESKKAEDQESQKSEEKAVEKSEENQVKIDEATPSDIPQPPPLPQSVTDSQPSEASPPLTVSSVAAVPGPRAGEESNLSLQQSISGYVGGPLAPQENQPKTGGARLFGVHPGVTPLDSQPWQGRVGVNVDVPKFTPPKPFPPVGQDNKTTKTWKITSPDAKLPQAMTSVEAKPKVTPPQPSPSLDINAASLQKGIHQTRPSQRRDDAVDKENYGPDMSMSKVKASGLKPWQLSHIRALEAKGILVQNENKEDQSEDTYRLAHLTSLKKPATVKTWSHSTSTIVTSQPTSGDSPPRFYPPTEQKAVRSVPFNPMKQKAFTAPTPVFAGVSEL